MDNRFSRLLQWVRNMIGGKPSHGSRRNDVLTCHVIPGGKMSELDPVLNMVRFLISITFPAKRREAICSVGAVPGKGPAVSLPHAGALLGSVANQRVEVAIAV